MGFSFMSFLQGFNAISVILLIIGLLLLIVEMFIPGFGLPGISGILCLVGSVIARASSFADAVLFALIIFIIICVFLIIFFRSASKGKLSKSSIVLSSEQNKDKGFVSTTNLDKFVGKTGIAKTILRPSGIADFDNIKLDVVTQGEFIERECKIIIKSVEGRRIVVEKV